MSAQATRCDGCGAMYLTSPLQCRRCGDSFDGPLWLRWIGVAVVAAVAVELAAWGLGWRPPSFTEGAQNQALFSVAGLALTKLAQVPSRGFGRALDEGLSVFSEPVTRAAIVGLLLFLVWIVAGGAVPTIPRSQAPQWWRDLRLAVLLPWAPAVVALSVARFGVRWLDPRVKAPARRS